MVPKFFFSWSDVRYANFIVFTRSDARFVLRWMWAVMGLVVTVEDEEEKARRDDQQPGVLISNHVSPLDTLGVHLVTDSVSVSQQ